ncbi:MAG: RNA polymerase sigma factor [Planctomycetota bacterium]|nr:RNA polymerase sigma factor [Planctomycetota bacterium]
MSPSTPAPEPDALSAHGAFLRRLARSLVRDEQRAEDIVQEAYIAVLKRPPPPRVGLRAWMSGIVKNLARRSVRTDSRRRSREEHAAPSEPPEAPDDITVRLELQQRLTEAVRVLAEPMRTTVVKRYYDGLTPTQIAEAEGVSVRTIESRLRRAREQLRGVLDKASGGQRGRWMLAFAPMAFDPQVLAQLFASAEIAAAGAASSAAVGAPAVAASFTLAVAMVGAVGFGAFVLGRSGGEASVVDDGAGASASRPAVVEPSVDFRALERDLLSARAKRQRLEVELAALRGEAPAQPEVEHDSEAEEARWKAFEAQVAKVRFSEPESAKQLDEVNWADSGRALVKLNAAMVALNEGETYVERLEAMAQVQLWNPALVVLEVTLRGGLDVDVLAGNEAFTRPYVQANLLYAALLFAQDPLSAEQAKAIEDIAARFAAQDRAAEARSDAGRIVLRRVLELTVRRRAFFDEVGTILTPTQREIVNPGPLRGRVGFDLFSDGAMWQELMEPLEFTTTTLLEEQAVRLLALKLKIQKPAEREIVLDEVRRWIATYPAADLQRPADGWDESSVFSTQRVRTAASASADLYERLIERLPEGTPAHEMLTKTRKSLMPLRRP